MAGVSNFLFTSYLCPAIIQPEAFDLCSPSSRPNPHMKRNLLRIATTLKAIGSLKAFDDQTEPWMAEISAKIKGSTELMKQFTELMRRARARGPAESQCIWNRPNHAAPHAPSSSTPLYLLHAVLYWHHAEIVSSSDNLIAILRDLGNMPDQLSSEQNKQVRTGAAHTRMHMHTRTHAHQMEATGHAPPVLVCVIYAPFRLGLPPLYTLHK